MEMLILGVPLGRTVKEPRTMQADADRDPGGPGDPPGPAKALLHLEKLDAMLGPGAAERGDHRASVHMLIGRVGGATAP